MSMKKENRIGLRTWVEIDKNAIRSNYRAFRKFIPATVNIMGIVKSNAYGHNITEFASELESSGANMLAVDSLVEALVLKKSGIKIPILVLGYTLPEMYEKAFKKNIHITISSLHGLKMFFKSPFSKKIPIHLKVDTGMHRQGFLMSEKAEVFSLLNKYKKQMLLAGLYTHFASAKDPEDKQFTEKQIKEFEVWRKSFFDEGYSLLVHAGATGGALAFRNSHFDMVRVGIGLYGVYPSSAVEFFSKKEIGLKPALSWKTIISEIKEIEKGEGVGYDLTHSVKKKTKIAVCPVGYWHGYFRSLSNNAHVLVRGARANVLGRVSMDMIVIDVSGIKNIKTGDEVALIGKSGKDEIFAADLAEKAGTSAYELLTRINPLIKRFYI